jgi:hypothetical protein
VPAKLRRRHAESMRQMGDCYITRSRSPKARR